MFSIEFGKVMEVMDEQPKNAQLLISLNAGGKEMALILVQFANAPFSMQVTVSGIVTEVSPELIAV